MPQKIERAELIASLSSSSIAGGASSSAIQGRAWDQFATEAILSAPPAGMKQVINLYVNPQTGKLVVEWDDS